ncbi:hypothetical protein [Xanthocytophaga agilis]|uniref:Uncharacterized protein n=1 Tax=Xanthocytophaga agilis TaxID=3048010 RepID=A0AAE3QY63_9BACT|nr:hypothetical protein [Xanthocytophaga agilis]MDJ1499640.1 hypothetical protein [Xanthocytophaga agilis]
MNNKAIVRLSNIIGIVSIISLVYWVFIFISITVFELKIFRENITETFYLSVVGILALMFGSLIINIMFNLTRIAEKHNQDELNAIKQKSKKVGLIFALSFPVIFGLLLGGDYLTSKKKEKMLIATAKSIIENNKEKSDKLLNYSFTESWIIQTDDILDLYSKTDKHFPSVSVIVSDSIDKSHVLLGFSDYYRDQNDKTGPVKKDFIQETTQEEREYLENVFFKNFDQVWFSARNGQYELFYPYIKNGKRIVLYFSEYQRYGKIGS